MARSKFLQGYWKIRLRVTKMMELLTFCMVLVTDSENLGTVDRNGAALLWFFRSKKLFGAPPYRVRLPKDLLSLYCPAPGQLNFWLESSLESKVLSEVDVKKLLGFVLFILTLIPLILLLTYRFWTNDREE